MNDIENLEVIIHFPKDFDTDKAGATHGQYGTVNTDGIIAGIKQFVSVRTDSDTVIHFRLSIIKYDLTVTEDVISKIKRPSGIDISGIKPYLGNDIRTVEIDT